MLLQVFAFVRQVGSHNDAEHMHAFRAELVDAQWVRHSRRRVSNSQHHVSLHPLSSEKAWKSAPEEATLSGHT